MVLEIRKGRQATRRKTWNQPSLLCSPPEQLSAHSPTLSCSPPSRFTCSRWCKWHSFYKFILPWQGTYFYCWLLHIVLLAAKTGFAFKQNSTAVTDRFELQQVLQKVQVNEEILLIALFWSFSFSCGFWCFVLGKLSQSCPPALLPLLHLTYKVYKSSIGENTDYNRGQSRRRMGPSCFTRSPCQTDQDQLPTLLHVQLSDTLLSLTPAGAMEMGSVLTEVMVCHNCLFSLCPADQIIRATWYNTLLTNP